MTAKLITGVIIFFSSSIYIYSKELPENDLSRLRELLFNSTQNEDSLDSLFTFISDLSKTDDIHLKPLLLAYKGVGNALLAKYSFFPWDKLSHLDDGLQILDDAVELDSSSLEIRFVRFSVLNNIPSFLGYSSDADAEAYVLYKMLKSTGHIEDRVLIQNVVRYLVDSERLDKSIQEDLIQKYNLVLKY